MVNIAPVKMVMTGAGGWFIIWLVVSTPSEKYESQLGWWNSQYIWKVIKFMFQTTNQSWFSKIQGWHSLSKSQDVIYFHVPITYHNIIISCYHVNPGFRKFQMVVFFPFLGNSSDKPWFFHPPGAAQHRQALSTSSTSQQLTAQSCGRKTSPSLGKSCPSE